MDCSPCFLALFLSLSCTFPSHSQAGAYRHEAQSYWSFLRNASLAHGLQMEFMRSAPGLWKMARLYRRLMALQGRSLVVRYEDLAATPVQVQVWGGSMHR